MSFVECRIVDVSSLVSLMVLHLRRVHIQERNDTESSMYKRGKLSSKFSKSPVSHLRRVYIQEENNTSSSIYTGTLPLRRPKMNTHKQKLHRKFQHLLELSQVALRLRILLVGGNATAAGVVVTVALRRGINPSS